MPERARLFFFDTVTLSNFALSNSLDLLVARYGRRACITPQVLDGVSDGVVAGYAALRGVETAATAGSLGSAGALSAGERDTYRELLRILSPGEASCIACAKARGGTVVTDDRTARTCCAERNVEFTGTIGILKACALDGTLSPRQADDILQAMVDAGYYSPVRRISDLI